MSAAVFFAILFAAALHAGWNALVKTGLDRFSSILFLGLVQGGIALLLLPFFGLPPRAAWPWVLAGSALHSGYKLALIRAYGHGDLSQIYPLSRGTAPLIVAVAGALFLGETMDLARTAAVVAIAAGIMLMAGRGGLTRAGLGWALVTAGFTAAYTLADGVGARVAGSASAFILTMIVLDGADHARLRPRRPRTGRNRRDASGVAAGGGGRGDVARRLLDRDLGLHPGAAGDGRGAARDQRPVRDADRGLPAQGEADAAALGGRGASSWRGWC